MKSHKTYIQAITPDRQLLIDKHFKLSQDIFMYKSAAAKAENTLKKIKVKLWGK